MEAKNNDFNENTDNSRPAGDASERAENRVVRSEYNTGNYYKELYNDLPKEVVELLMKTHPLMGRISDRKVSYESEPANSEEEKSTIDDSDTNRIIDEERLSEKIRERQRVTEERTSYIKSMDLERIGKEASLDEVFGEDNEDSYRIPKSNGLAAGSILTIVVLIVLAFFAYKTVSLSGQLKKANASIKAGSELSEKYEQLKLDNLALEEENRALKSGSTTEKEETTAAPENPPAVTDSTYTEYTVVAGDTFWGIASKVYGDGGKYNRILEANGLTENSSLPIGKVLKIPN